MMQSPMSSPELMDPRFSQLRLPASSSSKFDKILRKPLYYYYIEFDSSL